MKTHNANIRHFRGPPNFMKAAGIAAEVRRRSDIGVRLIHTGQHYPPEMSHTFFNQLGIPAPISI